MKIVDLGWGLDPTPSPECVALNKIHQKVREGGLCEKFWKQKNVRNNSFGKVKKLHNNRICHFLNVFIQNLVVRSDPPPRIGSTCPNSSVCIFLYLCAEEDKKRQNMGFPAKNGSNLTNKELLDISKNFFMIRLGHKIWLHASCLISEQLNFTEQTKFFSRLAQDFREFLRNFWIFSLDILYNLLRCEKVYCLGQGCTEFRYALLKLQVVDIMRFQIPYRKRLQDFSPEVGRLQGWRRKATEIVQKVPFLTIFNNFNILYQRLTIKAFERALFCFWTLKESNFCYGSKSSFWRVYAYFSNLKGPTLNQ